MGPNNLTLILTLATAANLLGGQVVHVHSQADGIVADGAGWATAFRRINDALQTASAEDEIWVAAGIYHEFIVLKEGVALYGGFAGNEADRSQRDWNLHRSILEAENNSWPELRRHRPIVMIPPVRSARLDGFTVRGGTADFGGGIYCAGGSPILANNTIVGNTADGLLGGGGVFCDASFEIAAQSSITMFRNVAQKLFDLYLPGTQLDAIELHPVNRYTPELHRLLQVAANIVDASNTNEFPSVFRPTFAPADGGGIMIGGYVEETGTDFLSRRWLNLQDPAHRSGITSDDNVHGIPLVVGAKKGLPNFNEFSLHNAVSVVRKLELKSTQPYTRPSETNQMYFLSITNLFGAELWNSYTQAFTRPVEIRVTNWMEMVLSGESGVLAQTNVQAGKIVQLNSWGAFKGTLANASNLVVPLVSNVVSLRWSQWMHEGSHFAFPSGEFERDIGFPVPKWNLSVTNRLICVTIDLENQRVLDVVNLGGLNSFSDVLKDLDRAAWHLSRPIRQLWATNRLNNSEDVHQPTTGIRTQIDISTGRLAISASDWSRFNASAVDRTLAILAFRDFVDGKSSSLVMRAPFAPSMTYVQRKSWQANDPVVHYTAHDLLRWDGPGELVELLMAPAGLTNGAYYNLGKVNASYSPWGGNPFTGEWHQYDPSIQDRAIRHSSEWDWPAASTANLSWLNRIHRGTPWQTIYFGRSAAWPSQWTKWAGSAAHPTNDWALIQLFAERQLGLEGGALESRPTLVNNTIAANTAASDGGGVFVAPGSAPRVANNVIAANSSGIFKTGDAAPILQANCLWNVPGYDYAGVIPDENSFSQDPQFRAPGSFHLLGTSPCVDTGDESVFAAGWLHAEPARQRGSALDRGASELSADALPLIRLTGATPEGQFVRMQLIGFPGASYVVEGSTNLIDWSPIFTNLTQGGFFEFQADREGTARGFYRGRFAE